MVAPVRDAEHPAFYKQAYVNANHCATLARLLASKRSFGKLHGERTGDIIQHRVYSVAVSISNVGDFFAPPTTVTLRFGLPFSKASCDVLLPLMTIRIDVSQGLL